MRLQTNDYWHSVEVKTALALIRAVVYPAAAGEQLAMRIIDKASSSGANFSVPLTQGFGE